MRSAIVCALGLLACGHAPEGGDRASELKQPVIGGKESPAADDGVVIVLIQRAGASICSGALVAPNLLLTARHCVTAVYEENNIRCNADGSLDEPSGGALGEPVAPEKVRIYLGADPTQDSVSSLPGGEPAGIGTRIVTTDWPSVCRDDLALVILDRDVAAPIVPLDLTTPITKAMRVSTVGYGLTESSDLGDLWSARRRRDSVAVKYVDTLPNTFGVGRAVCQGDSGGPALDAVSGGIVGVYSLGFPGVDVSSCSSENALNYYARLNAYESLLREGFDAAGQPFPEPAPSGGGAPSAEAGAPASPAPAGSGGVGAAGGAEPEGEAPLEKPRSEDEGGCNLSGSPARWPSWLLAAFALLTVRRRR